MIFKNLLKIMLPSLLVAGSVTAFAAGDAVVRLANNTMTTWADFTNAINDPSTAEVKATGTLAADNAALVAYQDAQAKVVTDSTAYANAETTYNISALTAAVTTATTDSTTYANTNKEAIANAEKAYNESVAYIPVLEQELADSVTNYSTLLSRQQKAYTNLQTAITNLSRYETALANLPKKKVTPQYLQTIYDGASAFNEFESGEYTAYYRLQPFGPNNKYNRLLITFGTEQPNDGASWSSTDDPKTFDSYITDLGSEPNQFAIYLGQEYVDAGNSNPYLTISSFTKGDYPDMMTVVLDKLDTTIAKMQTEVPDTDSQAYKTAKANVDAAQADVDKYTRELNGFHPAKDGKPASDGWTEGSKEVDGINEVMAANEQKQQDLKAEIASRKAGLPTIKAAYDAFLTKLDELHTAIVKAEDALAEAEGKIADALAALNSSKADRVTAAVALNKEYAAADAAATAELYQTITLTGDVTATTEITKNYNGTIKGGKYVINNSIADNAPIFAEFSGTLTNAGINGALAEVTSGRFYNVAVINGSTLRLYSDGGTPTTPASIGVLGYNAREFCGVDFTTRKLVGLTDATIVHSIDVYNPEQPTVAPTNYYATQTGTKFVTSNNANLTLGANEFAVAKNTISTEIANVIYPDANENMVSDKVVITDKKAFFAPVAFEAATLSYDRTFAADNSTVILPFPVKKSDMPEGVTAVSTYDSEEDNIFWFTVKTSEIEANTPMLLSVDKEVQLTFENVNVAQTPADQYKFANGSDESKSFGTFKTLIGRDEVLGAANAARVYGLTGGKFQPATSAAQFPAFRMVICSANKATPDSAPRRIGFKDEQGKEINIGGGTTAIEDVEADAAELTVKGGVGELTITAGADYGKVEIYALDGRVAAVANVTEGVTSVSLQNGLYIVMGKKVVVK